jgi:cation transport ATPase
MTLFCKFNLASPMDSLDAFKHMEDKIRRQEQENEARKLRERLQEIENAIDKEKTAEAEKLEAEAEAKEEKTSSHKKKAKKKTRSAFKKLGTAGTFCLILFASFIAVRMAFWISFWLGPILVMAAIAWVIYKLVIED